MASAAASSEASDPPRSAAAEAAVHVTSSKARSTRSAAR
jgi:hypothetical protein